MEIKNAVFDYSIQSVKDIRNTSIPEIAVVGKSNVGKSSLVNMLTNNGKLARVSKQPGKTRLINYFRLRTYGGTVEVDNRVRGVAEEFADHAGDIDALKIPEEFYLVDLPGYGFARVSKEEKSGWDAMMGGYFSNSSQLKLLLILMDIRHNPTQEDLAMVQYAEYCGINYAVVATKADKIAKTKRIAEAKKLKGKIPASFDYEIFPVSSEDGFGKAKLLAGMAKHIAYKEEE